MKKICRSEQGAFLGVCRGIEESLGIRARYIRAFLILLALLFNPWIVTGIYLLAALLMPLPGESEWRIQNNFEKLSRDAGEWSRREYNDFKEMMRGFRKADKSSESKTV